MPIANVPTSEPALEITASHRAPIALEFDPSVPAAVRPRIDYAFRVFAAIYGHPVWDPGRASHPLRIRYGGEALGCGSTEVIHIPALYGGQRSEDSGRIESPPVACQYAGQTFHLSLGLEPHCGKPDWLGEIFRWLSGEGESQAKERDSVGRAPYSETIFGRHGISPRKPHAALLMAWLENVVQGGIVPRLPKSPSPLAGFDHIVLASHDIDFYYSGRRFALLRLAKNLAIAALLYKSPSFFFDNLKMMTGLLTGKHPGEYLLRLLGMLEEHGLRTTIFPVVRRAHRRNPTYSLENVAPSLAKGMARGFSVGLHGSYRSVMEDRSLSAEAAILGKRLGKWPRASRQHWLRFENHRQLFREIESAGIAADSSLGFPDAVGFRNGASFAFPPYDFERECPHRFLEIPLVLMDGGLEAAARCSNEDPQKIADDVLAASRSVGWGGVSLLWHDPLESLLVPPEINEVFWNCTKDPARGREAWITFDQFLSAVIPRYQQAGLLEGLCADA